MFPRALTTLVVVGLAFPSFSVSPARAAACSPTSTVSGSDTILTFTTVGSCTHALPAGVGPVTVLVVGGGGGGSADVGGGGGGGQVVETTLSLSGTVTVVVGGGGAAGYNRVGNPTGGGRTGGTSSVADASLTTSAKGGAARSDATARTT